jgi:hypothetical protein
MLSILFRLHTSFTRLGGYTRSLCPGKAPGCLFQETVLYDLSNIVLLARLLAVCA